MSVQGSERQQIEALVARFDAEVRGAQDRAEFAAILDEFRRISTDAYANIGKPLFLTFVRNSQKSDA